MSDAVRICERTVIDVRLINADALMETINRHCYPVQHDMTSIEPGMTRIGILQAIQEQPTVEPERKTGKWIDDGTYGDYHPHHAWHCSECEESVIEIDTPWFKFCPNCGADMRGEQE